MRFFIYYDLVMDLIDYNFLFLPMSPYFIYISSTQLQDCILYKSIGIAV